MGKHFDTYNRKDEHIYYSLLPASQSSVKTSWLECAELVHIATPEVNLHEVNLATRFLGCELSAPLLIAGMTGGTYTAEKFNAMFARAAEELKIAIGVGSQRIALERPEVRRSFQIVRKYAINVPVIANIGASQVIGELGPAEIGKLVDMVEADALAIHLNPLQEVLQIEGDSHYYGFLEKLEKVVSKAPVPVIVKETGAGISKEVAEKITSTGVLGIDVGGAGGTSFAKVEGLRALGEGRTLLYELAEDFAEWGIPTAASVIEVRNASADLLVIATGGIRNGVDVAKAIRLGADLCGLAYPVIRAAAEGGYISVVNYLKRVIEGLRRAAFLTGSRNLVELKRAAIVIRGGLREWIEARGLKIP